MTDTPTDNKSTGDEIARYKSLNEKLEADRLNLRSRLNEQDKYIYHLHRTLENHQHARHQFILLAHLIDAVILRRINAFDRPKATAHKTLISPELPSTSTSKSELIELAQANDLDNFYTVSTSGLPGPRHLVFIAILQTYNIIRRLGRLFIRIVAKLMRLSRRRRDD
ncbi:MAG TPA: hypothetical protein VII55_03665 [Candidatus Saccharimonadales bacterium]